MNGWIKCSDRLPEVEVTILAFWNPQHIEGAFITPEPWADGEPYWVFSQDGDGPPKERPPTHWMPLPEPPNETPEVK